MARPLHSKRHSAEGPALPVPARETGPFRFRLIAHSIACAVALILATGLATAGTTLAMNAPPLPLVNTAAFVFLLAATVVSGSIVVAFWRHLLIGLAPPQVRTHRASRRPWRAPPPRPLAPGRQRPARPMRNI
ncbi:hypothetical protein MNBD_ALPHA09-1886 [hydrothermal vent metagenome]|uniref:Uncharacterized protein n=1 Tax=hydrothermal vent metagenome TaxID=652676 RepID=A0A3B0TDU8_9ZZZZ